MHLRLTPKITFKRNHDMPQLMTTCIIYASMHKADLVEEGVEPTNNRKRSQGNDSGIADFCIQ